MRIEGNIVHAHDSATRMDARACTTIYCMLGRELPEKEAARVMVVEREEAAVEGAAQVTDGREARLIGSQLWRLLPVRIWQ